MATGGRVLHHLAAALPDPKNTVLFVGYQAAGRAAGCSSTGAKLVQHEGARRPGRGAHRADRFDVGARRRRRDHAWLDGFERAAGA